MQERKETIHSRFAHEAKDKAGVHHLFIRVETSKTKSMEIKKMEKPDKGHHKRAQCSSASSCLDDLAKKNSKSNSRGRLEGKIGGCSTGWLNFYGKSFSSGRVREVNSDTIR